MPINSKDLWSLVLDRVQVDPDDLVEAIQAQASEERLDFRTRLLIRDSLETLRRIWDPDRLTTWLQSCPVRQRIEGIWKEDLGPPGFPFLREQLVELTRPETIRQFLRELGGQLHRQLLLHIGGSGALILLGYLSRKTQDLDVVDEIPAEIRYLRSFLDQLMQRYRLQLAHFQSHFLPKGWEKRLHSLEPFGQLQVFLVDVHDIFLSKLFSAREKDRDDLRSLVPQLEKETLVRLFRETTGDLMAEVALRRHAEKNWFILYGEPLPS